MSVQAIYLKHCFHPPPPPPPPHTHTRTHAYTHTGTPGRIKDGGDKRLSSSAATVQFLSGPSASVMSPTPLSLIPHRTEYHRRGGKGGIPAEAVGFTHRWPRSHSSHALGRRTREIKQTSGQLRCSSARTHSRTHALRPLHGVALYGDDAGRQCRTRVRMHGAGRAWRCVQTMNPNRAAAAGAGTRAGARTRASCGRRNGSGGRVVVSCSCLPQHGLRAR